MSGLFSSPKVPKDTSIQDLEAQRKKAAKEARDKLLTSQRNQSQYGRQSTILTPDNNESTLLGG